MASSSVTGSTASVPHRDGNLEQDSNPVANQPVEAHQPTAVRFSSVTQEISPETELNSVASLSSSLTPENPAPPAQYFTPQAQGELRALSQSIQNSRLQQRRMSNFAFEPVSLPASRPFVVRAICFKLVSSRAFQGLPYLLYNSVNAVTSNSKMTAPVYVPSNESNSQPASREISHQGSRPSPPIQTMHTPPLTPAATPSRESAASGTSTGGIGLSSLGKVYADPVTMTPQISPPSILPPVSVTKSFGEESERGVSATSSRPSSSSDQVSTRPTSISTGSSVVSPHPKRPPKFTIGPTGDSIPPSRDASPPGTPGTGSGIETPVLLPPSRPFTPVGDKDDPYARNKRPPQPKNLDGIESRFIFGRKDSRRAHTPSSSFSGSLHSTHMGTGDQKKEDEKRHSHFSLHSKKDHHLHEVGVSRHGSMSDLKRFFRGGHKKRTTSPSCSLKSSRSGTRTPPHHSQSHSIPFADDHGLTSKYGKFGKVLGAGAGGSVRLMKRSSDGVTFAVKEFRTRHSYESEREYAKKVTAEFCIGSTLHHGNIIETLDIVQEKGKWYEVMEFAPYDLFAIVMTGKMSREEVACSFLQILNGVIYLHGMGLAHRDLKLDNVVVNEHGIMKIIDFGSASVFRYPFENDIVHAHGVVGSDPYLAPEVYDNSKYDPQPTDIWSLAIIFCCMSLRRFPWKAPRISDNSYKLFASAPIPGQPTGEGLTHRHSAPYPQSITERASVPNSLPGTRVASAESTEESSPSHHHHHHHRHHARPTSNPGGAPGSEEVTSGTEKSVPEGTNQQQPVIKGPWRLLRLLPRESRNIIGSMLEINPGKRATLEEVVSDPWISSTPVCRQEDGGLIVCADVHTHTLEPGAGAGSSETPRSSK
ncbi:MAG: serine/threonine protein kinase [Geoglossum umbratile]|nr:MAG: serine/threonine protein kinase [Geoglossum umbratile]